MLTSDEIYGIVSSFFYFYQTIFFLIVYNIFYLINFKATIYNKREDKKCDQFDKREYVPMRTIRGERKKVYKVILICKSIEKCVL